MKNKLRIMQITHDLAIGGLQQVVVNICRSIDKNKFDISVLCLRDLGEYVTEIKNQGVKVIYLPQKHSGTDYFSFLKVAKILRDEQIDIIHTHNTQPLVDGTIGAILSGVKTIIHTDHARKFPDKKRYMFAEWLMSHFVNKIVGVSEHTSNNLIKYEKISPKKIITIPNGIDGLKYNIKIDREKKKKELGITRDGPIIGLGVRLIKSKGITYLLKAMPELIKTFPDITLVIAGMGDYENQLKKEANEIGVDKNTLFIGPRLDMPELLKLFDLYVLPSLSEGLPMVLLEAMAAGCPIIATKVGGIELAITDGENGLLIEPRNSQLLTKNIITLLNDNKLRASIIKNGYRIFKEKFSAQIMMERYEKLYLEKKRKSLFGIYKSA